MKTKRATLILLALPLLCSTSFLSVLAQDSDAGQALVVEVKNAAGQPLKHACVTYIPKNGEVQFRNADARGRVEFKNLTTGEGRVVAKVSGYTAQKKAVMIKTNAELIAFALEPRNER